MATLPKYEVTTKTTGHKIVKAGARHLCFGVPVRVNNFWVLGTSPLCSGVIEKGALHLEFANPLTRLDAKACLPCVLTYDYSQLEGELGQYRHVTQEELDQARVDLEADVAELLDSDEEYWLARQVRLAKEESEKVGRIRPLRPRYTPAHDWGTYNI